MLSLAKVSSGEAAASYYEVADDYYHAEGESSQWWGDGAERLGLSGAVDSATFRDLLDGKMLDGTQIHNAAEGRRAGTDFTFSAPKSVSMQALIGGDARLIDAHEQAVTRALDYAQTLAAYRVTKDGITRTEASGNLLAARFRHELSRANDPNVHTHAVVINATARPDGAWRALEQTEYYRQKMLMGALYRSELALEVQKLGYAVKLTHADGRFELSHLTPAQIEAFSSRSQAIETALAARGTTRDDASARVKEIATLATRERKTDVDRAVVQADWRAKSQALHIDYAPRRRVLAPNAIERTAATNAAVAFAVAHTTEREAVVSEAQLVRAALEYGTGRTDLASIQAAIAQQARSGALVTDGARYTTHEAQARERAMLEVEQRGRHAMTPLMTAPEAAQALVATGLNDGQRAAAALVMTTDARVIAIQGRAGTGKTTMLHETNHLVTARGYRVIGLAPSKQAVRELAASGIPSQTLAAFGAREDAGLNARTVIVVDEAGMVSAKDMHAVLRAAEESQARVVLVGDTQQLYAIEAGKPFAQLQEAGIARVVMSAIQRQSDATLRAAVEHAAKGEVHDSVALLHKHINQIDSSRARYEAIAKDYKMLPESERAQTLLVAGTHAARRAINEQVRAELGRTGTGMPVTVLVRKDMTQAQARSSLSYQPGDLLQAQKAYRALGLQRGDVARVLGAGGGIVRLERTDGARVDMRPAIQTHLTAYRAESRELSVGDAVRLTANDYARGSINGDTATVTVIDAERQSVTLMKADGHTLTLDASQPLHLDHGYCTTVHAAQGQTVERVLLDADTRSVTANESSYYVAISRARSDVTIYTDDRALLPEAMSRANEKSAALDIRRETSPALER